MPKTMMRSTSSVVLLLGLCAAPLCHAERADRLQPMVVESDGRQAASVDLNRKITVLNGNVSITQGTLRILAERVEIREEAPGRFMAQARGSSLQPTRFRQKRDRQDEVVEAESNRVEYDSAAERVRFIGDAKLRVLRNGKVSDEAHAAVIVYDQKADTLVFEGGSPPAGAAASTPANGRARLVFVPRQTPEGQP
jgi:lipopolysaccharide export system protein LptA